jgi:PAS domain S-box-containing protein
MHRPHAPHTEEAALEPCDVGGRYLLTNMWTSPRSYTAAFVVAFSLLAGIGIASYVMSDRLAVREDRVIHSHEVISSLKSVAAELGQAESAQRGYVLTGDRTLLIEYDQGLKTIPQRVNELQSLIADNPQQQQQQRLSQLRPLIGADLALLALSVDLREHDPSASDQQLEFGRQSATLDNKILTLLTAMEEEENQLLRYRSRVSIRTQRRAAMVLVLAFLLASMTLVALFLIMNSEVRRRTRAELLAKEGEERFRHLVNGIQDYAVIRLSLEGRIMTWNLGAERLFGYHSQEILGQPLSDLFQSCDHETPEKHLRTALRDGHVNDECQQLRKDGTVFWATADVTLLRNDQSQAHGYALIVRDITERRQQQEEIKQREAQLNAFFSNASVGLAIIDKDLRFQRINDPFSRLNGLPPAENTGLHVRDVVKNLGAIIEPLIRQVACTGVPVLNYEVTGHPPTTPGVTGWWLKSFFPIAREGEAVTQIGAVVQDITALKRAENTVRWLSGRLLQLRDDERRRLARDLHDSLGQTLIAVKMNISYLGRHMSDLDERGRNAMAESKELVDSGLKEVRTLSHLLHPPMLDEVGLLPAIRWFATGFAQRSGIDVKLELPATFRRLPVEMETAVFRVAQESLTNVHRHSGSATAVVRLDVDSDSVHLRVIDYGCGIPPQKLSFQPESPTIGVGLLGMRERLRQLGGQLEIRSNGGGTTVHVIIPLRDAA